MKKLAIALVLLFVFASTALALDDGIYGSWKVTCVIGSSTISTTFQITDDWDNRCAAGYLYVPDNFTSKSWSGSDENGDFWAKAVVVEGNTVFFCEANATKSDSNIPTTSWYQLEFNSSMTKFTIKGVTSTFTPGTYYLITGTGKPQ